jgi:pimeloyl-ACP methyl ester carboxylesterase
MKLTLLAAVTVALAASIGGAAAAATAQTPVEKQIAWAVAQVNDGGAPLTEADVKAHFAPSFLATLPVPVIVQAMAETRKALGPVKHEGFAGKPTQYSAIALIRSRQGQPVAIYATVERHAPHRVTGFEITERPGPGARSIAKPNRYSGAFPVGGGRKLFLNCSGTGRSTVILEAGAGGGSSSWQKVQGPLSKSTRVCSYDRANLPGGSSDPAPKPQTAADIVRDLHRALTAANVPKPYVLAGHSNGGLYARLYASTYPADVRGLVLVDSISEEQPARERELFKELMTTAQWKAYLQGLSLKAPFVEYVGDEQVDIPASFRQMRNAARLHPLQPMPLVVISHGLADPMDEHGVKGLRRGIERMWQAMQADLAALVPGGRRVVAHKSHHQIPSEQPAIIVSALRSVLPT